MTQSKPQGPSKDHHFIPQFLLRAWAGADNKVACCWPRADGQVRPGRLSPKSFGFKRSLYTTEGLTDEHASKWKRSSSSRSTTERPMLIGFWRLEKSEI